MFLELYRVIVANNVGLNRGYMQYMLSACPLSRIWKFVKEFNMSHFLQYYYII